MTLSPGTRLGPYEILAQLGAGGMGEVYRAKDPRIDRTVALKVLPEEFFEDEERRARFGREARTLASLSHPGIALLYSFEETPGPSSSSPGSSATRHLLVMELVEGEGLDARIARGPLPLEEFLSLATQIAEALSAAHEKGITHRDLKPANVKVTLGGRVKLLDFGLARAEPSSSSSEADETLQKLTQAGTIVGTIPYMSPEQVEGRPLGPATDVFSLGVVLYEMATGRRPFRGDSAPALMSCILKDTPPPPSRVRSGLPGAIDELISRCLEKDAGRRPSTAALLEELRQLQTKQRAPTGSRTRSLVAASLGLALVAAIAIFTWTAVTRSRKAAFVAEALPRIDRFAREGQYQDAFRLASDVERVGGVGAVPETVWKTLSYTLKVDSQPPGARVSYRRFDREDAWTSLGVTPLASARVPQGLLHWRAEMDQFVTADRVMDSPEKSLSFELRRADAPDPDMVLVPGGVIELWVLGGVAAERLVALDPFLIDRTEVTNREFARFVAAGGYARPEFWANEFRGGGRTLACAEAMVRFRDATGRPGPATWKLGGPPDGADDLPVEGLSWYEADAYARFMGKELPTLYHWYWADTAGDLQLLPGLMLRAANFEGRGPHRSSDAHGLGAHGARDMAGNVREWCANTIENGTRLTLGGAWNDPAYVYLIPEPRSPIDRAEGNGVRCVKQIAGKDLPAVVTRPLKPAVGTDYSRLRPVSNEVYSVLARFYDRQKVPLDARIESTDDSSPHWVKQKVTYAAGYGAERMTALLYLPRSVRPPYQVVLQMAGASTFGDTTSSATESDIFGWSYADYLIRGGRAVLLPLWKGSYERSDGFRPLEAPVTPYREHVAWWVAELRQSIDYLESRKDVDPQKIGYQGISFGSVWAPLFMALEPRLRCGVLLLGGFSVMPGPSKPFPPEMEPLNFAPRVKAPVLMLNGRDDAIFPYEMAQVPLFRVLGTPQEQKRHVTFPGGHSVFGWRDELHREGLDWLDRRFGVPVGAAPAASPSGGPR